MKKAAQQATASKAVVKKSPSARQKAVKPAKPTPAHVDAINQLFTEFELAYHNQFHKAFATAEQLMLAQQLWLSVLSDLSPAQIIAGARRAIKQSDFLPTPHTVREQANAETLGLPSAHSAYQEACRAPSPKAAYAWTHPAVYFAGRACDWYFLANTIENRAFPLFKQHYATLCERVRQGEDLSIPITPALPKTVDKPLSLSKRRAQLKKLRDRLGV